MSYYGIKNLKIVKTENGYNMSCSYYDSSIRDYNGHRVWYKDDRFFKEDYTSKEELEYALFKDFLDGNFHTSSSCGKFQCLSWNNMKVTLPKEDEELVEELSNNYYKSTLPYNSSERETLREVYYSTRYKLYYKAWLKYLEEEKANKGNKFIIKLNAMGYNDIYVKKLGSVRCGYTYYSNQARVFKGNPQTVLNQLNQFNHQSNIRIINV